MPWAPADDDPPLVPTMTPTATAAPAPATRPTNTRLEIPWDLARAEIAAAGITTIAVVVESAPGVAALTFIVKELPARVKNAPLDASPLSLVMTMEVSLPLAKAVPFICGMVKVTAMPETGIWCASVTRTSVSELNRPSFISLGGFGSSRTVTADLPPGAVCASWARPTPRPNRAMLRKIDQLILEARISLTISNPRGNWPRHPDGTVFLRRSRLIGGSRECCRI